MTVGFMILVTGGTGFLGRHLVARLCQAGYALRVLTRTPQRYPWLAKYPNVEVFQADLLDKDRLAQAIVGCTQVIHAAGLFSMWSGAGNFYETNSSGTLNLLQLAAQHNIKRVVFVSTIAVIGKPEKGRVIDEDHPPYPDDLYQESKLHAEVLMRRFHQMNQLNMVIVRPGAFYGPMGDYAFNRLFFTDPMRGIIMQMDGGKYIIFPAYIDDVAQGIVKALEKGRSGEVYNICGECLSHRDAFSIILKQANIRFPRLNIPKIIGLNFARFLTLIGNITRIEPFYPVGLKSYVFNDWDVSSEKAKRELGFVPTPFAEGVRRTLAWYQAGKPHDLPELEC
jgi:nucleoside-diphosphate-sugar epimerase